MINERYTPHRRPAAHRRNEMRFVLRLILEGVAVFVALWAVLATAEALCTLAGCPTDLLALR